MLITYSKENYNMGKEIIEILNNLIDAINVVSYDDLIKSFKENLHIFKYDMGNIIKSINPDMYWGAGNDLRDLKTRVELLLKLSDFIEHVAVLQGILINVE